DGEDAVFAMDGQAPLSHENNITSPPSDVVGRRPGTPELCLKRQRRQDDAHWKWAHSGAPAAGWASGLAARFMLRASGDDRSCRIEGVASSYISACRIKGAPAWGQARRLRSWFMPQNFLYPQRDQPLLMPADMREWLPEDDLVHVVLDAVATLDLSEFRRRYRADGHGRAAFDPEMMVALLLYGYCQGERSSRVIEKRCVRDVGYRVIAGGLRPDHATIARFRARHEKALGGLFSQVLRLLAAEGMVSLGTISLDGTKLAGNAAQKANRTLPAIGKLLAEAAAADAAEDARLGGELDEPTPRALARRAERRERLAAAADRLAAEDRARRDAQRAKQEAWDAAAAAGKRGGHRPGDEPPRPNRNNTEPRANITDPDVRVMRNQKGYVAGYNGQLVVTTGQVIVGAMLSQHPVDRTLLHPLLDRCRDQLVT